MSRAHARTVAMLRALRSVGPLPPPRQRIPRQAQPDGIRLEYFRDLQEILDEARRMVEERLYPLVPDMLAQARAELDAARADRDMWTNVNEVIDELSERFFDRLGSEELEALAKRHADQVDRFQREQLNRQIRAAVGVDVLTLEPNLGPKIAGFVAENVALIKSVPESYFADVEKRVTSAMRQGLRWEELAKDLVERHGVAESRAKLIARDQVGKLYGEIQQTRQEALGVKRFTWRSSKDNRVRREHEERDGNVYDWADPPDGEIPGHPINCRCTAEPVFDDLLSELDGTKAPESEGRPSPEKKPERKPTARATKKPEPPKAPKVPSAPRAPRAKPAVGDLPAIPPEKLGEIKALLAERKFVEAHTQIDALMRQHRLKPVKVPSKAAVAVRVDPSMADNLYGAWSPTTGQIRLNPSVARQLVAGDAEGIVTLTHEALHGYGRIGKAALTPLGQMLDEVTTEVAARAYVRQMGVAVKSGSYGQWIDEMTYWIADKFKESPEKALARLERASITLKKAGATLDRKEPMAAAFAEALGAKGTQQRIIANEFLMGRAVGL